MGRIKNTTKYPVDNNISINDKLIGSDAEDNGKTKNYTVGGILNLAGGTNSGSSFNYSYRFTNTLDVNNNQGYFTVGGTDSEIPDVNLFTFNKVNLAGTDLSNYFDVLFTNPEKVLLKVSDETNINFGYFKVVSLTRPVGGNIFTFTVEPVGTVQLGDLNDESEYILSFDIVEGKIPLNTSELNNDGENGSDPFITLNEVPEVPVTSVNSKTGDVVINKDDVGLSEVDNTSDIDKPISTAQQNAIDSVVILANNAQTSADNSQQDIDDHEARTDNPHQVTQSQVGLGNVDNTSDIDKPVSTAQQNALDLKIDEADVTDLGTLGLSVRDINGVEQFLTDDFIEISGGEFDAPNKRFSVSSLRPRTVYVDVTNGNDSTAEPLNPLKPYQTVASALLQIPTGQDWDIWFLDSATRVIPDEKSKRVRYITPNTGTMDISAFSQGSFQRFNFYCPNSSIVHSRQIQTTMTCVRIARVKCLDFSCDSLRNNSSNNVFAMTVDLECRNFTGQGNSRSIFANGRIKADRYITTNTSLFYSSNGFTSHNIGSLELSGQTFQINGAGRTKSFNILNVKGTGVVNTNDFRTFNVSNITWEAGVRLAIASPCSLTGIQSSSFLGEISMSPTTRFDIHDFYGRINVVNAGSGFNTTNVEIRNSTIFLATRLFISFSGTSVTRIWNIANTEFIQDTAGDLFQGVPSAGNIVINKTGYIKSNGTLGANVSVQDRTPNTY